MSDQGIPAWLQSLGFTEPTEEEKAGNVLKAGAIFLGPPEPISIEEWDRAVQQSKEARELFERREGEA